MSVRSGAFVTTLVSFALVLATTASASTDLSVATALALPKGATGVASGYLPALACASAGNCVAAGADLAKGGHVNGVILSERSGHWTSPTTVVAPTNAAASADVTIFSAACGAVNNCAVVGSYVTTAKNVEPLVANEVAGHWQRAHELRLPPHALTTGQDGEARAISCVGDNACTVVGMYLDDNQPAARNEGFVVKEVRGAWWQAGEVSLPDAANANPFVSLVQLSCASAYNCTAVGGFIEKNNVDQTLVVSEVRGVTTAGRAIALPPDASAYAGASLNEVTCLRRGPCTVVGVYDDLSGRVEPLVDAGTATTWPRASALTMPTSTNPSTFFYGFSGVSCASAGNCALGGQYRDANGNYQGFLALERAGTWSPATTLALPPGATTAGHNGGVITLSCPRVTTCLAGAAYVDANGNYQALVDRDTNGTWALGVKVLLPGSATTVGVDGGLYAIDCATPTACTATGTYVTSGTTYEGFSLIN